MIIIVSDIFGIFVIIGISVIFNPMSSKCNTLKMHYSGSNAVCTVDRIN